MSDTYKIISLPAQDFADEINKVADDYAPIAWNIAAVPEGVVITAVLVSARVLRQAQFAGAQAAPGFNPNLMRRG